MDETKVLAEQFEANRTHLRAVAYRMLGSPSEADDAVQEAWLRLSRTDTGDVANLGGWLYYGRGADLPRHAALTQIAARGADGSRTCTEPIHDNEAFEHEAHLADSVGSALLVVLDTLAPAERLAFVLHDMFAVPFEEIAPVVGRSPAAARQLASRARRRVQGAPAVGEPDLNHKRKIVEAFLAASRDGDFERLLLALDPDVVLRADPTAEKMGSPAEMRGAAAVAQMFKGARRPQACSWWTAALELRSFWAVDCGSYSTLRLQMTGFPGSRRSLIPQISRCSISKSWKQRAER